MKNFILIPSLVLLFNFAIAQNNVGIGTTIPNPNALLELDNNGNPLGLLLPRQDISTFTLAAGDRGIMVLNTLDNKVYFWDGTQWLTATSEWTLSGVNLYNVNSGNVGVGTTNPLSKLSVEGNMSIGTAYAGTNTAPTNSLIVQGNVGIGNTNPQAPLQFASVLANRKIVMWTSFNNDHQFYGLGISSGELRFQVDNVGSNHVFYAGLNSTTSSELMRVTGTGRLVLPATADASGTTGTGVIEVAGSLRMDGNEIITNTNSTLFIQNDNNGDLSADGGTFYLDASADRIGISVAVPDVKFEVAGDIMATNGVFTTSTNNADISGATNIDHLWHNDATNAWHMVSDDTYKAQGNTSLNIGTLIQTNNASSLCATGGSPFFLENCNDVTSTIEFSFTGSFTGSQVAAMPDLDIQAVSDGGGAFGLFSNSSRFNFRQNNSTMVTISSSSIYPGSDNAGSCGQSGLRWSTVYATNGAINTSDRRQKKNIKGIQYGLGEVMQLRPVSFNWKKNDNGTKLGLIAQDLQEIIPEVVSVGEDEDQTLGVFYSDLIPVLVKAIQEQQEEIESLKTRMSILQASN